MADPLTTFAAAGNALQFVQLGIDIIRKTIDYSRGGGNHNFQALQDCVQRLSVSSAHLQESMASRASRQLHPGAARALYRANLECLRVSREFTTLLDKLGFNRPHTLWSSVKLALKTHVKKGKVETMSLNLDHARANLMLSLMVFLHDQSAADRQNMSEEMRVIAEQTMKTTAESEGIRDDIAKLSSSLSSLSIDDRTISLAVEDALTHSRFYLTDKIKGLSKHLEPFNDGLKAVSGDVCQLLPIMTREIAARRSVMESLWFSKINHRRNRISRAHTNTYQWIFRRKDSQVVVWDDFIEWLNSSRQPIYWISGKPGSGKSTLIHELDERADELQSRSESVDDAEFLKASFYFWYAGTSDEKSMSGLLRSLIHQLLSPHLELIDQVISASRWEASLAEISRMHMWEETELVEVLCRILQQLGTSKRILLFIDGLDEHDGSDDQRQEVLDLLHTLTKLKNVKACVASRPYNIFRDEFQECPQLRLEDLTKDDIRYYVRGNLSENPHFQRQQQREPQLLHNITEEITSRARGVFLWVRLVVRDLLRVLRDGGRTKHLFRELESIPLDLDEYFRRIFDSIERPYRKEASIILQTALRSRGKDAVDPGRVSDFEFLLIHLHFLENSEDLCFAAKPRLYDINFDDPQESQEFLDSLERMLVSRSMGLLETDSGFDHLRYLCRQPKLHPETRIEFLHRTVRDYFAGPAAKDLLHQHAGGSFDAHMFQCNLMVTNMTTFAFSHRLLSTDFTSMMPFLRQILQRPDGEEAAFVLFEKMAELLNDRTSRLRQEALSACPEVDVEEILTNWNDHCSNAMSLSIQLGWTSYIKARLTAAAIQQKRGRPLLDYALRPCRWKWTSPNHDILRSLLALGANPDTVIRRRYDIPVWVYFVESIQFFHEIDYTACVEVIRPLIMHGVRRMVTETDLIYALKRIVQNLSMALTVGGSIKTDAFETFLRGRLKKIHRSRLEETDDPETLYSFLDVLESLAWLSAGSESSQYRPVFTEADIAAFKELERSQRQQAQWCRASPKPPVSGGKRARYSSLQKDCEQLEWDEPGSGHDGEQPLHKKTRTAGFLGLVLN